MKFLEVCRDFFSVPALLGEIGRMNGSASPEQLVSISMASPAIRSQQVSSELTELSKLVKELQCKQLLEIGSYRGGTLFVFSRLAAADATVISLDCHFTLLGKLCGKLQIPLFHKLKRKGQSLFLVRQNSHAPETAEKIDKLLQGRKLDFLFIDGDHKYEGVRGDFEMYSPFVRSGGLVAFHDIANKAGSPEVHRFWDEIKQNYPHREFVHRTGKEGMGIGVLWV